jgi:hypothetical protein
MYNSTVAPRRRVAIFLPNGAAGTLSVDGLRLLKATIFQTVAP